MPFKVTGRVPSWAVGLTGALIVVFSVALSPLSVHGLEEDIRGERGKISRLTESHQRLWGSHTLADQRAATADMLAGFIAQAEGPPHQFLLGRAGGHLQGAILAMWAGTGASDDQNGSELEARVGELLARFNAGDLNAYDEMASVLDDLRLASRNAVNGRASQRTESEARLQELELSHDRIRALQSGMNILGLVIVLLKDLPIWRRRED